MNWKSCIYEGKVRHRRNTPRIHQFDFRTFMLMLDLDELESVFSSRWLWSTKRFAPFRFRSSDYLKDFVQLPELRDRAIHVLANQDFHQPIGSIRLLTQVRYFGFSMNPVSFFYCYSAGDEQLIAIIAEVNNTPWGEQHCYVIPAVESANAESKVEIDNLNKAFHVSPFMSMEQSYRMAFSSPGEKLGVKIENHLDEAGEDGVANILDVSLLLNRKPISGWTLNWMLVKFPFISFQIFVAIYWHAIRLYMKKIPFVSHPKNTVDTPLLQEAKIAANEPVESDDVSTAEQDSESILVS